MLICGVQNNIAAAKLAGILTDLNLKGVEFNVSIDPFSNLIKVWLLI